MDLPCQSGFNNSLDGGDCLNGGHYRGRPGCQLDATEQPQVSKVLGPGIEKACCWPSKPIIIIIHN